MLLFGRSRVMMAFALVVVAVYAPHRCFAGEVFLSSWSQNASKYDSQNCPLMSASKQSSVRDRCALNGCTSRTICRKLVGRFAAVRNFPRAVLVRQLKGTSINDVDTEERPQK